jgi:hypothetical protein
MKNPTDFLLRLAAVVGAFTTLSATPSPPPATPVEAVDTATVSRIIDEGMNRSHVMDLLSWLTDVHGPRLTWSPAYRGAMEWAERTLSGWGLTGVHREGWTPLGRGWTLQRYSATVVSPRPFPLLSYPKAWCPGTPGEITGEAVFLEGASDSALSTYRGKLRGRIVLIGDPQEVKARFLPLASRETDSSLLAMANADPALPRGRRGRRSGEYLQRAIVEYERLQLCQEEGAAAILTPSRGDGGVIFVQSVTIPTHPDSPLTARPRVYEADVHKLAPQIAVASEHYNRMVRILRKNQPLRIALDLKVQFTNPDSGYNLLAEIPGSDLRDEVVMIGGHLDSWHGGTGATDNGTGVATSMEAMRILKTIGAAPRRTIRLGLWGGEEEGLLGSRAYVRRHLARLTDNPRDTLSTDGRTAGASELTPAGEKFSCYFNNDNGTGRIRGIYLQGYEAPRPIFRAWLAPFRSLGASTITPLSTSSTDHIAFTAVGLPAFQFIQDDIEYFTRTWHSTMDVYDRAQEDDLKQAAVIIAAFAYNAAMRDERLPRRQ